MKKRIISILLTLLLIIGITPFAAFPAVAEEADNKYVVRSWDGTKVTEELCDIPATATMLSNETAWGSGVYVADGTVELSGVTVTGNAELILKDGCALTVSGGINVSSGNSLEIYAQKYGMGKLTTSGTEECAGIGSKQYGNCGTVTIHGGYITATAEYVSAGIGSGMYSDGSCGSITIYGGNVTATGGAEGGAGIGTAAYGDGGSIAIYGGNITATGGAEGGAGIGSGCYGSVENITIGGGNITATGGSDGCGIGGGFEGSVGTITLGKGIKVTDGAGDAVTLPEGKKWADVLTGPTYTLTPVVVYLDAKGKTAECDTYTVVTPYTTRWEGGWYVVNENVTINDQVVSSDDVKLILCDGKTLKVDGSIQCFGAFSIYAQSNGKKMGKLNSDGIDNNKNSISICGGFVSTTSGIFSAGNITITGGEVCITYNSFYGIYSGGYISIRNANVSAMGDIDNTKTIDGIYSNGDIIVISSKVSAIGHEYGICAKGKLEIYGDDVTMQGGEKAVSGTSVVGTVEIYNQSNKRVTMSDGESWKDVLTDTYYRCVSENAVPYLTYDEESGELKTDFCCDYKVIDVYEDIPVEWSDGWYVVTGEPVIIAEDVSVSGEVHLILTDEASLTVNGTIAGETAKLYIHSQSTDTDTAGRLICTGQKGASKLPIRDGGIAIEVNTLTVNGAVVTAAGGEGHDSVGASGYDGGAAISVATLTANTAVIMAVGGNGTEPIGEYWGGDGGAGIAADEIILSNDTVITAAGGTGALSIDRFKNGDIGIAIELPYGKTVNGIATVKNAEDDDYILLTVPTNIRNYRYAVLKPMHAEHSFTSDDYHDNLDGTHSRRCLDCYIYGDPMPHDFTNGVCVCGALEADYTYLAFDETSQTLIKDYLVDYTVIDWNNRLTTWENGKWYVVKGEPVIDGDVTVSGKVHLILTDGSTLTVNGSIAGDADLILHSQSIDSEATGKLICTGKDGVDIDISQNGGDGENALSVETLTVDGAVIMATGGPGADGETGHPEYNPFEEANYGKPGGKGGLGGNAIAASELMLHDGVVTAIGGKGGKGGDGCTLALYTETPPLKSGGDGGDGGNGGAALDVEKITVLGGTVTASGGTGGIGGQGGEDKDKNVAANGQDGVDAKAVVLKENGTIAGTVTVKNTEEAAYAPLSAGGNVSDYRYAYIFKTSPGLNITATDYDDVIPDVLSSSFFVEGVQIRLFPMNEGDTTQQGMRFIATLGKDVLTNFAALNSNNIAPGNENTSVGFLVAPTASVGSDGLTMNSTKKTVVPAANIFDENTAVLQYTVCILGIDAAHWKNDITARPYIIYKDANGDEHTVYGDAYSTCVYDAVQFGIDHDPANAEALTALMDAYKAEIAAE